MELRHLRYFVAVADELHFGRAALRLGIAQPPLSQQIRKLEAELGLLLFHRTRRRVELTDAGRSFLDEAKAILLHAQRAAEAAQRSSRGELGRLVVGFAPWADFSIAPLVIRRFGERHPDVHVQVVDLNVPDQLLALHDDRIQVGFVRPPVHDPALTVERVFEERVVVAFPDGHRLGRWKRVPVRTLADEPHLLVPRQRAPVYHDLVAHFCRDAGFTLAVRHEADHPHTILSLVTAGMGIALVPASSVRFPRPGVDYRPLDPAGPLLEMAVAWRPDHVSPALQAFLEVVREQARAMRRPGRHDAIASSARATGTLSRRGGGGGARRSRPRRTRRASPGRRRTRARD